LSWGKGGERGSQRWSRARKGGSQLFRDPRKREKLREQKEVYKGGYYAQSSRRGKEDIPEGKRGGFGEGARGRKRVIATGQQSHLARKLVIA